MRRRTHWVAASAVALELLAPARALADEPTCARVRVWDAPGLGAPWRKAAADLREQVARLPEGECNDAVVLLAPDAGGARLVVTAPDGRQADRRIASPATLVSIAAGLLASIPAEPVREAPRADTTPTAQELPPADAEAPTRPSPAEPPRSPATLGVSSGARAGFPTGVLAPELEVRGDIRLAGWIVSLSGRGSPTGVRPFGTAVTGFDHKEFSFGVAGGRRVGLGSAVLDLTAGPRVGVITEEGDVPEDGTGGTLTDFWVQAAARLALAASSRWHPTATLELDFAPGRVNRAGHVDETLPALPSWSAALLVGVAADVP